MSNVSEGGTGSPDALPGKESIGGPPGPYLRIAPSSYSSLTREEGIAAPTPCPVLVTAERIAAPPALVSIRELPSPNHDDRPDGMPIDMLILHYTGMQTAQAAIDRLRDPEAHVSSHYVVDEDGAVFRLVPEHRRAYHAGVSHWRGHTALNGRSIGIEIVNPGHEWGYRDFPALQMAAVCDLCLEILSRHPIPPRNVVAHSDVAPHRKEDPGEKFDWEGLARNGVGLWPDGVPDLGTADPTQNEVHLRDVRGALVTIGYEVAPDGPLDPALATVLRAFQRHWRPEAVNGQPDAGTRARLLAMAQTVDGR